jgi:hypothetical protein
MDQNRKPNGMFTFDARQRSSAVLEADFGHLSDEVGDSDLISDREAAVLLDQAHVSAKFWGRRKGTEDADEVAARAMLAYLESRARSARADSVTDAEQATVEATGRPPRGERPDSVRGYVHRAVLAHTVIALSQRTGRAPAKADIEARLALDTKVNEMSVALGRELKGSEHDALAAQIRMTYPAGERPRSDYHRSDHQYRVASLEEPLSRGRDMGDTTIADVIAYRPEVTRNVQTETVTGSFREKAELALDAGGRGAQLSARSLAWQVMAEQVGAPMPVPASMSEYSASKTRKVITAGGGAVAVARKVRDGSATAAETEALLRPFGSDLTAAAAAAALKVITIHPGYGNDLWDASVLAATRIIDRKT